MTAREELADVIEAAIDSVHDMDVTHRDYANAAADAVLGMIREARQAERDACLAIIEDMKSDAAISAAARARYTAMQASNASFNECRHRIRGRIAGEQE